MKLTYLLILLMLLVFFAEVAVPGLADSYAFSSASLFERPWTLLTSAFLHANIMHLLSNLFVFFFFGIAVEEEMGKWRMLLIFLLGAILGNIVSAAFYLPDVLFLGASAGIFALVGTGMLVRPLDWSVYPFLLPVPLAFLGVLYAIYNIYAFYAGAEAGISYAGHLAGLAAGLPFGFQHTGFRKGVKIIALATVALIAVMILIPIILGVVAGG